MAGERPMSDQTLATSVGQTQPYSLTFEVSDHFLKSESFEWSEPVQFRFERRDDGSYDLVLRRTEEAA